MTQYIVNASLIPKFLGSPNNGTDSVLVITRGIFGTAPTPVAKLVDPSDHYIVPPAIGTHIMDLLGLVYKMHKGTMKAMETNIVTLNV